jgi:hypothetical protein
VGDRVRLVALPARRGAGATLPPATDVANQITVG